jgi:hypothetical protein
MVSTDFSAYSMSALILFLHYSTNYLLQFFRLGENFGDIEAIFAYVAWKGNSSFGDCLPQTTFE